MTAAATAPAAMAGTVTILFTDLVSSTEMLERLGDEAMEEVRRVHFRLLREAVAASGGREVKNLGDGLMVVFKSALDAVGCAVAMQRGVSLHNGEHPERRLSVRVGLHAGEPFLDEGGEDYFGTPVVVAKRLCDSAEGGQILASELVWALIGTRGNFSFRDVGPKSLKGLSEPLPARQVDWDGEAKPGGTIAQMARTRPEQAKAGRGSRKAIWSVAVAVLLVLLGAYLLLSRQNGVAQEVGQNVAQDGAGVAQAEPAVSARPVAAMVGVPPGLADLWIDQWEEGGVVSYFKLGLGPEGRGRASGKEPGDEWADEIRWTYADNVFSVIYGEGDDETIYAYRIKNLAKETLTVQSLSGDTAGETIIFRRMKE